ncbi:MAG: hypothetical protein LBU89_04295 [Fibromonadaceae bacterium]|jgi:hypothetical protein|nr:hypothetical protein [Fibromonadaceae bacterium]
MGFAVRVSTLYVGQGQCNVIEVYRDGIDDWQTIGPLPIVKPNGPWGTASNAPEPYFPTSPRNKPPESLNLNPTHSPALKFTPYIFGNPLPQRNDLIFLGLVDFGSKNTDARHYNYALQYIAELIEIRSQGPNIFGGTVGNGVKGLDYVNISHVHKDHYNKIGTLADFFVNTFQIKLHIDRLIISGASNAKIAEVINKYEREQHSTAYHLTGFRMPGAYPYTANGNSLFPVIIGLNSYVQCRIHNLMHQAQYIGECPKIYHVNTGSTMLLLSVMRQTPLGEKPAFTCLFTGDATEHTLQRFTDPLYKFDAETKYVTIPHHGSETTIQIYNKNFTTLARFLDNYPPHIASASANKEATYYHPQQSVLNEFIRVQPPPPPPIPIPPPPPIPIPPPPLIPSHYNSAWGKDNFLYTNPSQQNLQLQQGTFTSYIASAPIYATGPYSHHIARNVHLICRSNPTVAGNIENTINIREYELL